MIVDCIGCLHGNYPKLKGGDILIVSGDLTASHSKSEFTKFTEWYLAQNYSKKVIIAGNHDTLIENGDYYFNHDWLGYLCDSGTTFENLKIWGSPWSAQFKGINPKCCAFTFPFGCDNEEHLNEYWDMIPDDVDILITHTPPYGILDGIPNEYDGTEYHTGSKSLLTHLEDRIKPKLHVFSHIHEHGGKQLIYKRPGHGTENNTTCVNASIMNEKYKPVNKPVRIIL